MVKRRRGRVKKLLIQVPGWMFQARLGFPFRKRIIGIQHEGRTTGKTYVTPVEVLYRDKDNNEYFVISARGDRADWYRNITKYPASAIHIGSLRYRVSQRLVPIDEAMAVMKMYERDHAKAARAFLELAGVKGDSGPVGWRAAMEQFPMVAFQPR
jgi:deazaflavin-dependent oxidoreductase (nitroreductase family)